VPVAGTGKGVKPGTTPAGAAKDPLTQRLAEADAAFAAKDYARSLELYRQVDVIAPSAATQLGIGASLQMLSRPIEAYDVFEQLMRERGSTLARADFERVEQSLVALRAATAVLVIQVKEAGAAVSIDQQAFASSPLDRSLRRPPGSVVVSVTKPGFEPFTHAVELRAGEERRVNVELQPARSTAWLVARSSNAEPANLWIDGKDLGPLPFTGEVPAGEHQLIAKSVHAQSAPRGLHAVARSRYEVELALVQHPAKVSIAAADAEAAIQIDSVPVAVGHYEGEVPPGMHVVTVEKSGFEPQVVKLTLNSGEWTRLDNVTLKSRHSGALGDWREQYRGFYGKLALDGMFGRPTHTIATKCPVSDSGGSCKSWSTIGAELNIRAGYSFGMLGAEGFVLLGSTFSRADMTIPSDLGASETSWYGIARNERYLLLNPTVAGGVAARIASRSQALRVSSSWGIGLAWHQGQIGRTLEAVEVPEQSMVVHKDLNVVWSSSKSSVVPLLVWDADLELGGTPGLRFLLGLHCQLELGAAPSTYVGNTALGYDAQTFSRVPVGGGNLQVWGNTNFFIGPRLGIGMGH
jgi:hypothetical protein